VGGTRELERRLEHLRTGLLVILRDDRTPPAIADLALDVLAGDEAIAGGRT
jgi:hypothetical protein